MKRLRSLFLVLLIAIGYTPLSISYADTLELDISYSSVIASVLNTLSDKNPSTLQAGEVGEYQYQYYTFGSSYADARTYLYIFHHNDTPVGIAVYCKEFPNGTIEGIFNKTYIALQDALGFNIYSSDATSIRRGYGAYWADGNDGKIQWSLIPTEGRYNEGAIFSVTPIGSTLDMFSLLTDGTTTPIPSPAPTPANKSTITMAEYSSISIGMTLDEVAYIVGSRGEQLSTSSIAGHSAEMRMWDGEGGIGANAIILFSDGKVSTKAQTGLTW